MAMTAFIFPGQGSQVVGMGSDLYEQYASVREIYQKASDILGFDIAKVSFEGPEQELGQTRVTQPALFVHSCAVAERLQKFGFKPDMTAGHSLGEYSALVAAGALDFEQGLRLVKIRGELMQEAGEQSPGTMAAIIGLEFELVGKLCVKASEEGVVQPANFNSPAQIVVSGTVAGVHKVISLAKEAGAKRAVELKVSGAFHSPLMASAQERLREALWHCQFENAQVPIYCNVSAKPTTDAKDIRVMLSAQLTNPVIWNESIKNMIANGAEEFIEIGAGNVLTGLLRRIDRNVQGKAVGSVKAIDELRLG